MGYARYPIVTVLGLVGGAPGGGDTARRRARTSLSELLVSYWTLGRQAHGPRSRAAWLLGARSVPAGGTQLIVTC